MSRRATGLALIVAGLALVLLLSVSVGARPIPVDRVWGLVWSPDGSDDAIIVHDLRVPRTILGLVVGVALGAGGALMQALTRNPLADPGLLGVNAGASAAVVIALAGTAITAALTALIYGIALTDIKLLQQYNFWSVGALGGRGRTQLDAVVPFIAIGLLIALALARSLNALALGDDSARALGTKIGRTRIGGAVAVVLLCGSATAAAGPMYFLGLTVPHAARALCGPDQRWILAYSAVLGGALMLVADVIGRVIVRPSEMPAGVMMAVIGTPLFIALVRRKRIAQL